jgi:hypothetical protein
VGLGTTFNTAAARSLHPAPRWLVVSRRFGSKTTRPGLALSSTRYMSRSRYILCVRTTAAHQVAHAQRTRRCLHAAMAGGHLGIWRVRPSAERQHVLLCTRVDRPAPPVATCAVLPEVRTWGTCWSWGHSRRTVLPDLDVEHARDGQTAHWTGTRPLKQKFCALVAQAEVAAWQHRRILSVGEADNTMLRVVIVVVCRLVGLRNAVDFLHGTACNDTHSHGSGRPLT